MDARIELLCMNLRHGATYAEACTAAATQTMWERADTIATRYQGGVQWSYHDDDDEGMTYGDAYAYVPVRHLEAVLNAFDAAQVTYDYVDLPHRTPRAFAQRIAARYPRGSGIHVTTR
jgi:hypothetical protein